MSRSRGNKNGHYNRYDDETDDNCWNEGRFDHHHGRHSRHHQKDALLTGTESADRLIGKTGDDTLIGGDGNDFLSGGKGDDLIIGGAGSDTMKGGSGNNIFQFGLDTSGGQDVILDFKHGRDVIYLEPGISLKWNMDEEGGAFIRLTTTGTAQSSTIHVKGISAADLSEDIVYAPVETRTMLYTPFQYPEQIEMRVTAGTHIALLTPLASDDRYDVATLEQITTRLDQGWEFYAQFTGKLPQTYPSYVTEDGLSTIAVVPQTCGAGCGFLGATGIEFWQEPYFSVDFHDLVRDQNLFPHYPFYELGRNFWFYGAQLDALPGDIATVYAVTNRYLAMEAKGIPGGGALSGDGPLDFDQFRTALMDETYANYFADPAQNWDNTVMVNAPVANTHGWTWIKAEMYVGGVMTRIFEDFGEKVYGDFWRIIGESPSTDTAPDPAMAASENLINAATLATGVSHDFVYKRGGESFFVGDATDNLISMTPSTTPIALGFAGKDTINGSSSDDLAFGGRGDDILTGDTGNDTLVGGIGNDLLTGGSGNDALYGADGQDVFSFAASFGNDTITGFTTELGNNKDTIELAGFGLTTADFASRVLIEDTGTDTLVTIDADPLQTITLAGVTGSASLTISDFILV